MHVVASLEPFSRIRCCRPIASGVLTRAALKTPPRRLRPQRRFRFAALPSSQDENSQSSIVQENDGSPQIKETMADLDAILGIEPDEQTAEDTPEDKENSSAKLSPTLIQELQSLSEEVTQKLNEELPEVDDEKEKEFIDKMLSILKSAANSAASTDHQKQLLESLESLLKSVSTVTDESAADVQLMKDRVFGADTFWVTEVLEPNDNFGGHRFRGNMRGKDANSCFEKVESRVKELFGDKYEVLMFEETLTPEEQTLANPRKRICFQVAPAETAQPPSSPSWRPVATGVLFLFTLATSYILGVSSNIGSIPAPIVQYLSQPEHLNSSEWPDFVLQWNPISFLTSAAIVGVGVIFLQLAHELGHRIMAFLKNIKLKGSLFLPNTQIGTFGSSTQLDSLVKNRQDLWDLSFGGIAAGGIASFTLFITGLVLIQDGSIPKEALIPVPSVLFQGSTLIGGFLELVLGDVESKRTVLLHPFTVAGWCGLTTTALNTLPVGNLDGGRMMQSAFGRRTLNISSVFTYAGLFLGLIGSSLAFPFGLYVFICERDPEVYIQNQVTSTERTRQWISAISIGIALLILLPMGLFDAKDSMLMANGPMI